MQVAVTHNKKKNGVELQFDTPISNQDAHRLQALGFRLYDKQNHIWHATRHPAYVRYARDLEEALKKRDPLTGVPILPSYAPTASNINNRRFSYVTLTVLQDQAEQTEAYLVFDTYKKIVLDIATTFGHHAYGQAFIAAKVFPRTYKQKARTLLTEGRVITGKEYVTHNHTTLHSASEATTPHALPSHPQVPPATIPGGQAPSFTGPDIACSDYRDRVIAHMHDAYAKNIRLTRRHIEQLAEKTGATKGQLWEAVELSWLLWYKMLYHEPIPFESRLTRMVRFWNHVQPTYAYSDSSKEIYRQYSTPCPIGAIISQYTMMDRARTILDPSAGNGLLVMGAPVKKTHVNEIDPSRLGSLACQGFARVTSFNAAREFPTDMVHAYDVVVTNPPFSKWEDDAYQKEYMVGKYFHHHAGLARHMRLEHLMAGLALHALKDNGRAAIIIMGHIYFDKDGLLAKCRPFFNWLYRHYRVEDIINMNSFNMYNKQGTVERTMLILIAGRKLIADGVAPTQKEAPHLEEMVDSFEALWHRIVPRIGGLKTVICQLKTELNII